MPRFSRKALIGAVFVPIFFLALAAWLLPASTHVVVEGGSPPPGPQWWQVALAFILIPLAAIAPFCTTVLGLVAVRDIRYSQGRIVGLPLALADALFFPLLILDLLVGAAFMALRNFLVQSYGRFEPPDWASALIIGIAVLVIALVDFALVRAAWKAARKLVSPPSQASS